MHNQSSTNYSESLLNFGTTGLQRTQKSVTPFFISLHWLLVAAHIKSGIQALHRTTSLLQISLLQIYIPSRSLRSTSDRCLVVSSQRGTKSLFRTFSLFHIYTFTVPGWWNNFPTFILNADSLTIFKWQLKTHLCQHYLISSTKKKTLSFSLFIPSLSSLYLFGTMPETWYYEHFLCLFASLRLIALCVHQL